MMHLAQPTKTKANLLKQTKKIENINQTNNFRKKSINNGKFINKGTISTTNTTIATRNNSLKNISNLKN